MRSTIATELRSIVQEVVRLLPDDALLLSPDDEEFYAAGITRNDATELGRDSDDDPKIALVPGNDTEQDSIKNSFLPNFHGRSIFADIRPQDDLHVSKQLSPVAAPNTLHQCRKDALEQEKLFSTSFPKSMFHERAPMIRCLFP